MYTQVYVYTDRAVQGGGGGCPFFCQYLEKNGGNRLNDILCTQIVI